MAILTDVPERTIRYRLDRLWTHGLCGGVQPYVPKGSAPYHWYPSKLADSYARGAPLPKGGEKQDPSESFLEHAAAITGLYVALHRLGPSLELETLRFAREAEGREVFRAEPRESAIVPDANLILRSGDAQYHAHVEIDLGTMSMTRLGTKLGLYLSYARSGVWRKQHPYLPPLLFVTTSPRRVDEIIKKFRVLAAREERNIDSYDNRDVLGGFLIGACEFARDAETALTEPVWVGRDGADGLTFTDLISEPYKGWYAQDQAAREAERARRAHRERLLTDPDAHRQAIAERRNDPRYRRPYRENYPSEEYSSHLLVLEHNQRAILESLIDAVAPMTSLEREAYRYFLRRTRIDENGLVAPTPGHDAKQPLTDGEREVIAEVINLHLVHQQKEIGDLWARHPMLACMLRWVRALDAGELIGSSEWRGRNKSIETDLDRGQVLEERTGAYRLWQLTEARRRRARLGTFKQIAFTFSKALREVDEEYLRICTACAALAIPEIDKRYGARWPHDGPLCLYCGHRDELVALTLAEAQGLIAFEEGFPRTCPVPVPQWVRERGVRGVPTRKA